MSDTHAETVAFVRDTMLEQKAPPVTLVGPIGWARTNLFSGPFNTIVSVISILFVAWILSLILPWIFSPTWNATSLTECREIVGALMVVPAGV